mmetsp:Transcript_16273/g.27089  ORF Transcript_16273/g.27089 Transcript_16273/m.27089 type:complete len:356 (-) Transcript_16273:1488-2555(-)
MMVKRERVLTVFFVDTIMSVENGCAASPLQKAPRIVLTSRRLASLVVARMMLVVGKMLSATRVDWAELAKRLGIFWMQTNRACHPHKISVAEKNLVVCTGIVDLSNNDAVQDPVPADSMPDLDCVATLLLTNHVPPTKPATVDIVKTVGMAAFAKMVHAPLMLPWESNVKRRTTVPPVVVPLTKLTPPCVPRFAVQDQMKNGEMIPIADGLLPLARPVLRTTTAHRIIVSMAFAWLDSLQKVARVMNTRIASSPFNAALTPQTVLPKCAAGGHGIPANTVHPSARQECPVREMTSASTATASLALALQSYKTSIWRVTRTRTAKTAPVGARNTTFPFLVRCAASLGSKSMVFVRV